MYLPGVSAWGYLPRGCTCQGMYLNEGGTCLGSVPARGVPAQVPPPVDRQTPVKTEPSQTSFADGKNICLGLLS